MDLAAGVVLWPGRLTPEEQRALVAEIMRCTADAPFFRPTMPGTGKPFTVEMTNFGPLGWVSDREGGYRYQPLHPATGRPWPPMPDILLTLWEESANYRAPPEACLVNLYRLAARMGLHQDANEKAADAPVLSISLGDTDRKSTRLNSSH